MRQIGAAITVATMSGPIHFRGTRKISKGQSR